MRRRIMPSVLLFFVLMADTSILPVLTAWPLLPSFTLLTALSLSLYLGRTHGVFYGLIAGLLVDILVGYPLGFLMLLYTISCFVVATIAYLPEDMRRRLGITDTLLRLSVGIEDVNDLLADLTAALEG